jgi:hypothetical protein
MKYSEFVKQFAAKHKNLQGADLMRAAAKEWAVYKKAHASSSSLSFSFEEPPSSQEPLEEPPPSPHAL